MDLPAGSTWLTFTDQVSHAAMAGQYQFEQTFLLPVSRDAERCPIAASRARAAEGPATRLKASRVMARPSAPLRRSTGIFTRWRTLLTVVPCSTSAMNRWPCVDMAMQIDVSLVCDANQFVGRIAFRQLHVDRQSRP